MTANNMITTRDLPLVLEADSKTVFTFGQNAYGELGHGDPDSEETKVPGRVDFCLDLDVVDISCGNEHTAILCENGQVFACGYNDSGQCGQGNTARVPRFTEIVDLRAKSVVGLASGNGCEHVAAFTQAGALYTWGYNARGQCGHGITTSVVSPLRVTGLLADKVVTKVACSYFHTIVATADDDVFAFGRNDFGQCGHGSSDHLTPVLLPFFRHCSGQRSVLSLSCGQYHSVISLTTGGVYACGKNDFGQLGLESPDVQLTPVSVASPLRDEVVTQLACGYYHTLARTSEGQVFSFGRNDYGQLGLGHKHNMWRPGSIPYLAETTIVDISCGCYHSVALSSEGVVFPFGRNNHGQLGINNTVDSTVPLPIEAFRNIRIQKIATGFYHTACLSGRKNPLSRPFASTLSSDFATLVNNEVRSDVTFLLEGKPLHGHRCILMARCEPLERMLNGPMREGREKEIVIPNHSYRVFLAFVEYLYTDHVQQLQEAPADVNFAFELLTVADQFLVDGLKRKCERLIQKQITVDNVSDLYGHAIQTGSQVLKRRCFDYIMNHFGDVIATPGFSRLPQESLQQVLSSASSRGVAVRNAEGCINLQVGAASRPAPTTNNG